MSGPVEINVEFLKKNFELHGDIISVTRITQGHINETLLSTVDSGGSIRRYVHQRINKDVFPRGDLVVENTLAVNAHLESRGSNYPYKVTPLIPTVEGRYYCLDEEGAVWRTNTYLEDTEAYDVCPDPAVAEDAGEAFGRFLREVASVPVERIHTPIAGFQDLVSRYAALKEAYDSAESDRRNVAKGLLEAALRSENMVHDIAQIMCRVTKFRVTHNDPKVNNVLCQLGTRQVVAVIDLDTVMPGSPLYDFGDFVRQVGVKWPEDGPSDSSIPLEIEMLSSGVKGFLRGVGCGYFDNSEVAVLSKMPAAITSTLAVRFLTDFLNGDRYFRISYKDHNLVRAKCQFEITQSYLREEEKIKGVINQSLDEAYSGLNYLA